MVREQSGTQADADFGPEVDWHRYAAEPTGNGVALAAAILGTLGLLAGVNLWTLRLLFFGWIDIVAAPALGMAALLLAGLAPSQTGRGWRVAGFVTGAVAVILGIVTVMIIGS